jgi:hypothetical protein
MAWLAFGRAQDQPDNYSVGKEFQTQSYGKEIQ